MLHSQISIEALMEQSQGLAPLANTIGNICTLPYPLHQSAVKKRAKQIWKRNASPTAADAFINAVVSNRAYTLSAELGRSHSWECRLPAKVSCGQERFEVQYWRHAFFQLWTSPKYLEGTVKMAASNRTLTTPWEAERPGYATGVAI